MEATVWKLAFELARKDFRQATEILALKACIVNKSAGEVIPIARFGPPNSHITRYVQDQQGTAPLLNHVCRLLEIVKKIGSEELRVSWVNSAFVPFQAWSLVQFDAAFKNAPSALAFIHMATIIRVLHKILAFLDVGYMCLLECPDPTKASVSAPASQILTIANWPFPPKHVDPVHKWDPAAWPRWRVWPEQVHAQPKPHTLRPFVQYDCAIWISVNQAENSVFLDL